MYIGNDVELQLANIDDVASIRTNGIRFINERRTRNYCGQRRSPAKQELGAETPYLVTNLGNHWSSGPCVRLLEAGGHSIGLAESTAAGKGHFLACTSFNLPVLYDRSFRVRGGKCCDARVMVCILRRTRLVRYIQWNSISMRPQVCVA